VRNLKKPRIVLLAATISALTQLGAKVLRTDVDGAVAIRAKRHRLSFQRSKRWARFFFWN